MDHSSSRYSLRENKVTVGNSELTFDYPIGGFIEVSGMLIIRLEKPYKTIYNENVFGVNLSKGTIEWRIAKKEYILKDCPFIDLRIFDGQLQLFNWCSFYLIVNPLNGEIIEEGFTK